MRELASRWCCKSVKPEPTLSHFSFRLHLLFDFLHANWVCLVETRSKKPGAVSRPGLDATLEDACF